MQMTDHDIDRLAELLNIAPEIATRILAGTTGASDQTLGRCHGELHAAEYDPSRTADRRLLKHALDVILTSREAA